eukprot:m.13085 g.13085  ORF g.13085 m.13085 type:complete len:204 (-) comp18922_c0_seq2:145-756(-)
MAVMEKLLELAKLTQAAEETVTEHYVQMWETLSAFLAPLGSVFGFITSDVNDKLVIIRKHIAIHGDNLSTLPKLFRFEVANKTTGGSNGMRSASLCIQRLHRAVEFIMMFLDQLEKSEETVSPSKLASDSYAATLSQHHAWLVRKTVGVALHTMPNRPVLYQRMFGTETKVPGLLGAIATNFKPTYDRVQIVLTDLKLLDLNP